VVRVNDRGPFARGRIIDLSYAAASKLGILNMGTGRVKVEALDAKPGIAPATPQPQIVNDPIYVQVAAFANPDNANHLVSTIRSHTDKAVEIKADRSLYRVHVGPFGSETELNAFKGVLSSLNLGDGLKILR
jgi:rare lipoprotein A